MYFLTFFLQYLVLLLCIFLLEVIAGVLAYINYQEVNVSTLWLFFSLFLLASVYLRYCRKYKSDLFCSHVVIFPLSCSFLCFLPFMKSFSRYTLRWQIFFACLSVHVLYLYTFFPSFSHLSFSPCFLAPVFPYLLPGNPLPPVSISYQTVSLWHLDKRWFSVALCTFVSPETKLFMLVSQFKACSGGSGGLHSCAVSYMWWAQVQWNVAGEEGNLTRGFFKWTVTDCFPEPTLKCISSHSWTMSSDRTWRWPCSRNTSSRGRRASRWRWTGFSRRCWSRTSIRTFEMTFCTWMQFNVTHIVSSFFLSFIPPSPFQFKCCGSNNFSDWRDSVWIGAPDNRQLVPDSCCKTPTDLCGRRDHPSNIYKVEVGIELILWIKGWISKS